MSVISYIFTFLAAFFLIFSIYDFYKGEDYQTAIRGLVLGLIIGAGVLIGRAFDAVKRHDSNSDENQLKNSPKRSGYETSNSKIIGICYALTILVVVIYTVIDGANNPKIVMICIPLTIVLGLIYMLNKGFIDKELHRKKASKKEHVPEFEIELSEEAEKKEPTA